MYRLANVERFPKVIESGILYWSQEYEMSAHRCACGCGDVIQLPVDELNFRITQDSQGVTLRPSVGNWGVCDAHYYITNGRVEWLEQMSPAAIAAGRQAEDDRRKNYYSRQQSWVKRVRNWFGNLKKRIFG
ncbi:hypothetical protein Gbth_076_041 [Gluconobacter thailandicus F149-1 = NBRC 100600]|nr:DUF6527 family protein [Gluconobacter thailandicus]GAN94649.1 hypothetical protein Gbth_076_041 [Gluconobacter thailandicus F149-1 = NBRC 100600]GBR61311.1 hypothetical protein AA100600_2667 [Gluconobacter thailandicus F149-1 = NBRC 100600]GEL88098.1 hypothetical protein GTH01_24560 [Gluconobacter thailandicus F149-1 = NBRC 100600]